MYDVLVKIQISLVLYFCFNF